MTLEAWNGGASLCIDFWGAYFIQALMLWELLAFPMQGTPTKVALLNGQKNHALQANLELSVETWGEMAPTASPSAKILSCLNHTLMSKA